jgi:hypothetical protein
MDLHKRKMARFASPWAIVGGTQVGLFKNGFKAFIFLKYTQLQSILT